MSARLFFVCTTAKGTDRAEQKGLIEIPPTFNKGVSIHEVFVQYKCNGKQPVRSIRYNS